MDELTMLAGRLVWELEQTKTETSHGTYPRELRVCEEYPGREYNEWRELDDREAVAMVEAALRRIVAQHGKLLG